MTRIAREGRKSTTSATITARRTTGKRETVGFGGWRRDRGFRYGDKGKGKLWRGLQRAGPVVDKQRRFHLFPAHWRDGGEAFAFLQELRARDRLGAELEFGWMGGTSGSGPGSQLLEWWSSGQAKVFQLKLAADSCKKVGPLRCNEVSVPESLIFFIAYRTVAPHHAVRDPYGEARAYR
ncbi:hypothetical protein BHM03_00017408 [Ensete ventricosum]|nr:hypothetical protein BHM03_00017408 [Ensete ventricosum]